MTVLPLPPPQMNRAVPPVMLIAIGQLAVATELEMPKGPPYTLPTRPEIMLIVMPSVGV